MNQHYAPEVNLRRSLAAIENMARAVDSMDGETRTMVLAALERETAEAIALAHSMGLWTLTWDSRGVEVAKSAEEADAMARSEGPWMVDFVRIEGP